MLHAAEWYSILFALAMFTAVAVERIGAGLSQIRDVRIRHRWMPLIHRALAGDDRAVADLAACPSRHRVAVGYLLIGPLIDDHDPARIAATRTVARAIFVVRLAERFVRSRRWWRRALGLRALGLIQDREHTAAIVAALDDPHADVRAAALDALTDLRDPASMTAIVARLLDPSLDRGRRAAAVAAFGSDAETFVLALAEVDPGHLVNYARALFICGTAASRPALCRWAQDERAAVCASALSALATVGLDDAAARVALDALEHPDPVVRASAARALSGWSGTAEASAHLARHLDDTWTVAVAAARSLQTMGKPGLAALTACASRPGLPGLLARQMLWQARAGVAP
jgi:hypothetical protein